MLTFTIYILLSALLLYFLLVAYADLFRLARKADKAGRGLGTGLSRVWAVAHTTLLESWNARIWLLIPIWLVAALVLLIAVRPYDESERIPLYIHMLLLSQEILLLILMGILACL